MRLSSSFGCGVNLVVVMVVLVVLDASLAFGQTPVIQSIVPEKGAGGFGQLIAIQGFEFGSGNFEDTTVAFFSHDGSTACSNVFLFTAPSTPNELYVRLNQDPHACQIPRGMNYVTVTTPQGTSNAIGFGLIPKPAAPVPRQFVFLGEGGPFGCPENSRFDYDFCVEAYGSDTSGLQAIVSQRDVEFPPQPLVVTSSSNGYMRHAFRFPDGLIFGESAIVQLRIVQRNGRASKPSFGLVFVP